MINGFDMAKAKREIRERLLVDVVTSLDARIPAASRNPL